MQFPSWTAFFDHLRQQQWFLDLEAFVAAERAGKAVTAPNGKPVPPSPIYPPSEQVYRAFDLTPIRDVRVVILGQDPYHQPGQSHGLAFSVEQGIRWPPSLRNIIKEVISEFRNDPQTGDLSRWAQYEGVFLLNTALTVPEGKPGHHLRQWAHFTEVVLRAVVDSAEVAPHFILWGKPARDTFEHAVGKLLLPVTQADYYDRAVAATLQDERVHLARTSAGRFVTATASVHPSPLSADRGFFGSRPFSRADLALRLNNPGRPDVQVDWRLP